MIPQLFTLTINSHFFKISSISARMHTVLTGFITQFIKYDFLKKNGYGGPTMDCVYAAATADRAEYRFHISTLPKFIEYVRDKFITPEMYTTITRAYYTPAPIDIKIKEGWVIRAEQEPAMAYLDTPGPPIAKFVGVQTGRGKTFMAVSSIANTAQRVLVLIKSKFIAKWRDDFLKLTNLVDDDIVTVVGSASLMALMLLAKDVDFNPKVIIISNTTMQIYLKEYAKYRSNLPEIGYEVLPEDLCEHLKIGVRLVDEVHQDLHLNMLIDLHTHVPKSISLSATFFSYDQFIKNMHEVMYPAKTRFNGGALVKYIEAFAYIYYIQQYRHYQVTERGSSTYSHTAFEKSILKSPTFVTEYFNLIKDIVDEGYIATYVKKQKFAIFVATVDMATRLTKFLSREYPHLDVRRFVQEDEYENLIESDISVTTIISGGTAHDIPNLIGVLMTTAIDSLQANIQVLGRLRELEQHTPRFYYLSCANIDKQIKFHENKTLLMKERAKSLKILIAKRIV